ncbi:hypothetical protein H6P81_016221 [Aristolochia fimbriata]|uniref:Uncharacterized protein n=1 Tax=Aristolochia fimbriata TaxID=158543 RepID=A0AAV7EAL3_ARIFI|nr:hypothetical protein H6P81_016221 [Aristolochia fimbriata]
MDLGEVQGGTNGVLLGGRDSSGRRRKTQRCSKLQGLRSRKRPRDSLRCKKDFVAEREPGMLSAAGENCSRKRP